MSIEALIKAHTEALIENTEAVKLLTLSLAGRTATAANKAADAVDKLKGDSKKPVNSAEEKENPDQPISQSTVMVSYETVRALVLKLAPTQRDAIKALNAKHGIANLKVLLDKEDDFSTVNDQAKLEAVYTDLQALEG